jgi:hypothetical protein
MDSPSPSSPDGRPHDAEGFSTMRNDTEPFRTVPHDAEHFGTVPNSAEHFRTMPEDERAKYTLTVREAARLFERRNVARSERSITNWCTPNKDGLSRLACHFDPYDRRYWITPESVERVIAEELAKAKVATVPHADQIEALPHDGAAFRTPPQPAASASGHGGGQGDVAHRIAELEKENMDLKITNRAKDLFIEQLREDRQEMATERKDLISRVMQWALGSPEKPALHLDAPGDLHSAAPSQHRPSATQEHVSRTTQDEPLPDTPLETEGEHSSLR